MVVVIELASDLSPGLIASGFYVRCELDFFLFEPLAQLLFLPRHCGAGFTGLVATSDLRVDISNADQRLEQSSQQVETAGNEHWAEGEGGDRHTRSDFALVRVHLF